MQHIYVGIDLGGTAIKLALVSQEGNMLYKTQASTDVYGGEDRILYQMDQLLREGLDELAISKKDVKGIGIGAPGFMDMETGFIHEAVNLGWKNYPLKDRLEDVIGLPVVADNDANIAALGEMWQGSGEGAKNLLCLTLGTGVGGGVILNGTIYHGAQGTAGEIGHYTVIPEGGYRCNCGKTGCLETVASATGIVRLALDALSLTGSLIQGDAQIQAGQGSSQLAVILQEKGKLEAKDVLDAAKVGDPLSLDIVEQVGHYLGLTMGNYALVLNPEKIVIGGGVSKAGEILFKLIRQAYQKFALPHLTGNIDIVPASLGNDAGVIGAAWLVHTKTI